MATPKKVLRLVTSPEWQEAELEADTTSPADELAPDDAAEVAADLCPVCGDLLVWHEQACQAVPAAYLLANSEEVMPPERPAAAATFAYAIGHRVQPTPTLTAAVIWRGQLKERHPITGLIHRVNVYRLNDGYWDCYREEELQAA